jgi:hypothetical protein
MRLLKPLRFMWLVLLLSSFVLGEPSVRIRVEHANARVQPDSSATIKAVLNEGETYEVVSDVPYWYEIRLAGGDRAFVAKSLTTLLTEGNEGEEDTVDEIAQPLNELFPIPTVGNQITIQNCTPSSVNFDASVCPAEGSGGKYRRAYVKKNRVQRPCTFEVLDVAKVLDLKPLPADVRSLGSTDVRLAYLNNLESRAVRLEGFLAMVKKSSKEGVNCGSTTRVDLHVETVDNDTEDPKTIRPRLVVNEVSPWFREAIAAWTHTNLWQFASYRGGYSGTKQRDPAKVRIYGWLFYDDAHVSDGAVGAWRGTAWEVHPITRIEVFENGAWTVVE